MNDFQRAMQSIDVVGAEADEADHWREQVLLDEWIEDGAPDVDEWLEKRPDKPAKPQRRPARKAAASLPPSELRSQLTLSKIQAGALLGGMSEDWIEKHVLPHVKTLRASRAVLIDASDLQRWVAENSGKALG